MENAFRNNQLLDALRNRMQQQQGGAEGQEPGAGSR